MKFRTTKKILSKIALGFAANVAILTLLSCEQKRTLKLYTWTYYTPEKVIKDFEKEFDCKVVVTEYDSNETMYNKLVNGGAKSFDMCVPGQDYISIMLEKGMLQPINQELFTNRNLINPKLIEKKSVDRDMVYSVPYYFGASGICVNKKKVPGGNYERTWNIFADSQFKGHASMMDDYREVIGDALAYKGYSVSTTSDAELLEAEKVIRNDWLPNIVKFDAEGFGKDFARGDLWQTRLLLTSGRAFKNSLLTDKTIAGSTRNALLRISLPKFIWLCEIYEWNNLSKEKCNGIIVLDSTGGNSLSSVILYILNDKNFITDGMDWIQYRPIPTFEKRTYKHNLKGAWNKWMN